MGQLALKQNEPDLLLDCSQDDQVRFWAEIFQVSPQQIKSAVRACCNNHINCIAAYLKSRARFSN